MAHVSLPIIRRRLFTIALALSLLFFLATITLWVRSYQRMDYCQRLAVHVNAGSEWIDGLQLESQAGSLSIHHYILRGFEESQPRDDVQWNYSTTVLVGQPPSPGFVLARSGAQYDVGFPHWSLALLFAIAPALWYFSPHRRRAKRQQLGLCPTCGYDLRATPDRCPECGVEPKPI